jgi:phosphonate transport system substrate-binding protein
VIAVGAIVTGLLRSPSSSASAPATTGTRTDRSTLVVAVARTAGGPARWVDYTRVVKVLSEKLKREVVVRYIPEESKAVDSLNKNAADVAFVCPRTYLKLAEGGKYTGVAVPVIDGSSTTVFQLVTLPDSGIHSFSDLRGRRLAVSDKTSVGGWAYVQWIAARERTDVNAYFSEIDFGATMSRNLLDLRSGKVDATVINRVQADPDMLGKLRVIEQSGPVPNPPVIVSTALSDDTATSVRDVLLSLAPGDLEKDSRLDGFVRLEEADFALAADIAAACKDESHMR